MEFLFHYSYVRSNIEGLLRWYIFSDNLLGQNYLPNIQNLSLFNLVCGNKLIIETEKGKCIKQYPLNKSETSN